MFSFDTSYYYLILLFLNCFAYAKLQFDSKPEFVSTSDDCVLKEFAWKFAQTRIDWLGELPVVFDALNLATQCGLKRPQTIANRNVLPMTPSPTSPIEFFVAPNGNDNDDSSLHNPFQTIEKGLATIRGERFNAKRQLLPAKLILRGGNYNLTSTIVITGADSNTEITRFHNEFVALRGSQPLSLQWQQQSASPNVYRAKLRSAPFQALFVDGERAVRARTPNANPATDGTRHWFKHALHWKSPRQSPPPTQINISTPAREPTLFPRFATALGGSVQQFTPQESYWGLTNPHGGGASVYRVPSGLIANQTSLFGMRSGSNQTALVHAMHCGYWGSWAFNVDNVTKSSATIELDWTWGGFQEARGCSQGAIWFIENDLSFLDHPNEWFFDAENDYLYFFANGTHPNQLSFAKTNLEELIRIEGGAVNPVENFTLSGITLTETEPTFMKSFTVPSSGDVSLYPGAALTASKSAQLLVRSCRFVQLGGNALLLSHYNRFANISRNEFAWLGSNAICLVGRSELIDGTHGTQPRHTTIDSNLIRENGIVVKQSSAIFQAVTAQTTITNNILFNGPRAGINFNDEFGGDNLVQGNLGFNQVRETGDHGVFNSWNRTPFLTRVGDSTHASVFTAVNRITRNFFISNYASNWPIDHDDGSARFHDASNFLVYGGSKYFLGFEKKLSENIYVFADARQMWSRCVLAVGVQAGLSGWGETFVNNTCIYRHSTQLYQFDQSCDVRALKDRVPLLRSNTFFTPAARSLIRCGRDNFTLAQWQQTPTRPDQHSTIHDSSALSLHSIVEMGKRLLQV